MRRDLRVTLLWVLLLVALPMPTAAGCFTGHPSLAEPPAVSANAYVLLDARTGIPLVSHNAARSMHPASLTKLMTLVLAQELGRADERVTVSTRAAYTPGSSMGLRSGEVWTLGCLMTGLMLPSGNDAAVAIAEHIAGSVEAFAVLMNRRSEVMGLENTTFRNPHGLTEPGHMTTALDLASLAVHVLAHPWSREIISLREGVVYSQAGRVVNLRNTNRLLWSEDEYTGIKTGTTSAAGQCLIAAGRHGDHELIVVVLQSRDRWSDARRLISWGFESFRWHTLAVAERALSSVQLLSRDGLEERLALVPFRDVIVPVPRDLDVGAELELIVNRPLFVAAPDPQVAGELVLRLQGRVIHRTPLTTVLSRPLPPQGAGTQ